LALSDELLSFVRDALARGLPRERIAQALAQAGWEADEIARALAAFADLEFPIPVPRPKPYLSAREAFLYLVLFSTLYLSAFHLGSLVFQLIDHALPDPADLPEAAERIRQSIRWAVSSLAIAFPIFLFVSRLLGRAIAADPTKRASRVRKWLTYLTLFVAASAIVGDLTTLLYSFLGGELTLRFALKAATVGAIAGAVFGYYLRDLRREEVEGAA
jgi:hypothetical protein